LFNDTLRNNIAYGQPAFLRRKWKRRPQAALAHDFISELPAGYDTVMENEASGSPEANVSVSPLPARFLKNAPILILDEATSARTANPRRWFSLRCRT